jgi:DNA-binding CsgD family transcriptional regulator
MIKTQKNKVLTKRQAQVLNLYKDGVSVSEIAQQIGVKKVTIYATLKGAHKKLGHTGRLGKSVESPAQIPAGNKLNNFLAGLGSSFKSHKGKLATINIGCAFHSGDAKAKPGVYELASSTAKRLDELAKLAKASGKVFVRREFILQAIADRLKEVLS